MLSIRTLVIFLLEKINKFHFKINLLKNKN